MTSRSTPAEVVGVASASGRASEGVEEGELGDNAVVQSFWLGDELSPLEHLSAASFLAHGHQVLLSTRRLGRFAIPNCAIV